MIALVLAAVLSQADAGAMQPLYTQCPDAPLAEVVDGGYFYPELRAARQNCKLTTCEQTVDQMLARPESNPRVVLGLVATGVALVAVAVLVGYLLPHPAAPR